MEVTRHFQDDALANVDTNDVLAVREVNDQLMQLERHLYRSTPNDEMMFSEINPRFPHYI